MGITSNSPKFWAKWGSGSDIVIGNGAKKIVRKLYFNDMACIVLRRLTTV